MGEGVGHSKSDDKYRAHVRVYANGGADPNPGLGGWACVLISDTHHVRKELSGAVAPNVSNNRMELMAVVRALKALKYPCHVQVYSDSSYVCDPMSKGWLQRWKSENGWGKFQRSHKDLWMSMWKMDHIHDLEFIKLSAHSKNKNHNRCRQLMKRARTLWRLDYRDGYDYFERVSPYAALWRDSGSGRLRVYVIDRKESGL